jgi:hypothetical protein
LKGVLYYFFIFGFSKGNGSADAKDTFNLLFDLYGYIILLIFLFFESFLLKWFDDKYGLTKEEENKIEKILKERLELKRKIKLIEKFKEIKELIDL